MPVSFSVARHRFRRASSLRSFVINHEADLLGFTKHEADPPDTAGAVAAMKQGVLHALLHGAFKELDEDLAVAPSQALERDALLDASVVGDVRHELVRQVLHVDAVDSLERPAFEGGVVGCVAVLALPQFEEASLVLIHCPP